MKLPPLPNVDTLLAYSGGSYEDDWISYSDGFSRDDMQAYAAAVAEAVKAECVRVLTRIDDTTDWPCSCVSERCVDAIKSLEIEP